MAANAVRAKGKQRATRSTLTETTIARMQRLIRTDVWRPGEKLPNEEALSEQFAVGRSTIREAKRALMLIGAIEIRSRRDGSVVADNAKRVLAMHELAQFRDPSVEELYEIRCMLEGEIAALAAERASADDVEAMRERLTRMEGQFDQLERFIATDVEFHMLMAQATKNRLLVRMYTNLRVVMTDVLVQVASIPSVQRRSLDYHGLTLDAIAARAPVAARERTLEHLQLMGEMIDALAEQPHGAAAQRRTTATTGKPRAIGARGRPKAAGRGRR